MLVLSSPNSNGSYPRWSSVDVIFYFDDNTLPVGVKYEFKVVQPNGLVNYYLPKASHKIAVSLDAAGSYEVYGRMVGSAGTTSVWESITLLSSN
ncbi:hypothetical protein TH53_14600 [Pedobacter lusitanus]|uniref:Uncharacterized protein n=1 Tax=Pedobacter lusitanus TaxID=1503925 RepID=A0A0D0F4E2_9SPHI|nr:hypothetical protein TH53_14600 [Pedobacter lusitanus]